MWGVIWVLIAVEHIAFPFIVGSLARDKGRSFVLWFVFGLIVPVFALFYVMLVDDLRWPVFPWERRKAQPSGLAPGRKPRFLQ
jgi:hypothetical protein